MGYIQVLPGDIVFLTSDGISDNFDPVVGKFCIPKKPERSSSLKVSNQLIEEKLIRIQNTELNLSYRIVTYPKIFFNSI